LTLSGATILELSVKRTTLTLLYDGSTGGTGRYHVTATIAGIEHDLSVHDEIHPAAVAMAKWVRDRGLCFAPDSARRLSDAQRTDSDVLMLDVWTRAQYDAHVEERRTAWQRVDYDPYAHIAYRMGTRDAFPWLNTWA
jgi:hypothetical protein